MKKLYIYLLLILIISSCTDDFEEMNKSSYSAELVDAKFVIPRAQTGIIGHYNNYDVNSNVMPVQCQHFSQPSYSDESNYKFRPGMLNSYTGNFYEALNNLSDVEKQIANKPEEEKNYWLLITTTLKAFAFQYVTDANGPALFIDLFNTKNRLPKYASQQVIYETIMADLYKVVSAENISTSVDLGNQDLIYKGDVALWKKFANSTLLKYAMRVADILPEKSKEYFNKAVNENGGVFTDNADNARLEYLNGTANNTPWYSSIFWNSVDICASNTMIDLQKSVNDPRIGMYWGVESSSQDYIGLKFGETGKNWHYSRVNTNLIARYGYWGYSGRKDLPSIYMDYAQVEFFLAEAALRGGYNVTGSVKEHYDKAVTASIKYYYDELNGFAPSSWENFDINQKITDYLAQTSVNIDDAPDKLKRIGREKWLALFLQAPEAWSEQRRLDAPTLNIPESKTSADIPYRLEFSKRELEINKANVEEAKKMLKGEDVVETKLWWDTK